MVEDCLTDLVDDHAHSTRNRGSKCLILPISVADAKQSFEFSYVADQAIRLVENV